IVKFSNLLKLKPNHSTGSRQILVPISNGCNNLCSYCAVPLTRGALKCRSHKEIIKEVENITQKQAKEIWLLGQNVNNYCSPEDPSINFAKLVKMVCKISGKFKFFFMSPHPKNFSDELIDILAECPKFGKYLNLPVQSGDDVILKKMGRNYAAATYKNLIKKIRKKIPDINLSTDIIVGFPGETKKQFENTVKLFKEIKFNNAYISKYSPRAGTSAFNLKNNVPLTEKKRRWKILKNLLLY
ncbi:MAG: MiaB/RimO family radical SAM methylthiotransferase, partial [Candidatus Nealsonbacteria bacterium]|nr:MiaB/RimO family radical SAM methylthiotransferase [Candidatus Nealsonbacteria bacterium]